MVTQTILVHTISNSMSRLIRPFKWKNAGILAICLLSIFFDDSSAAIAKSLNSPHLKIGIYDNPPKLFLDNNQVPSGIFPGIINHIAQKEGWKIDFIPLTFKDGLKRLEQGSLDIMQDVAWSKKRSELYAFTHETVMVSWGRVFQRKGASISTLIDLKGKRIAVMDGGIYSDGPDGLKSLMHKFELDAVFIPAQGYRDVLSLIDQGKADAGVVNRLFGKRNKDLFDIDPTPILISPISIRFAFSRSNPITPQLVRIMDQYLRKMKKDENSIYYQLIDEFIREPIKTIPQSIKKLLLALIILLCLFAFFWALSSWQVRKKTKLLRMRDQELAKSEKKFRNIFENLQDVYFDTSISGIFKMLSPSAEALFDYPPEELVGHSVEKIYDDIADRRKLIQALTASGHVRDYQIQCRKKDRTLFWISLNADLYVDENQKPSGIRGVLRDITRQKETSEQLAQREERFREMARLLPCGIVEIDTAFNITYANQTGLDMFGYTKADFKEGLNAMDFLHSEDQGRALERMEMFSTNASWTGQPVEYRMKKRNGEILYVLWNSTPIVEDNRITGYRGSLSDLTQIKQLQKDILKNQKLESTGLLAGGIAHDFNNILLGLFGNISLAKTEIVPSNPAFALLEEAEKSMARAKDLTTQLLTFAQGGYPIKSAVTIDQIIRETASFNLSGSNIKIVMEQPEGLWQVDADKGQISQVISNLVINARQAMFEGGTLTIRMENAVMSEHNYENLELDKFVKISISDEGTGISEKHLEKIFDPYFTTKQDGSGLGLAIVHSIILKHKGYIYVNSILGKGTTFVIYLPAVRNLPLQKQIPDTLPKTGKRAEKLRVLVMDDDQLVLEVINRMMKKLGHPTDCCTDGLSAIEQYKKAQDQKKPYDLVIMDLTIPGGMGGKKAVTELLKIDPNATVVVSSGYSTDLVLANYQEYGFKAVIPKPFTVEKVAQVIDRAISC